MNSAIIAVGTELLFGQTVNTNASYLSMKLNQMGFNVMYHYVVGDNPDRLRDTLERAFALCELVILTGGLGPTQDDLTKELVSEYMGAELELDERVMAELREFFDARGRVMTENNIKQAYLPKGCIPLYNRTGTAPGFVLSRDGKTAICFPGPPHEMKWLFENGARQYLESLSSKSMYYKVVRTIGIGESDLETALLPLIDEQTDPTIATYAKEGECTLRVASQRDTPEEAKEAVEEMLSRIDEIVGRYIYSYDDEELNEVVVKLLADKGLKIASCESATAGMFSSYLADVPGASSVLGGSLVTYSDESKSALAGVDKSVIEDKGVVSPEVALQMAEGARRVCESDIGISVTAYAGPDIPEGYAPGEGYVGYSYGEISGTIHLRGMRNDRFRNRNFYKMTMLRTVYELASKGEVTFR